jgi:hypothetical protein
MSTIFANFQIFVRTEAALAYHKRTAAVVLAGIRRWPCGADHQLFLRCVFEAISL